MDRRIKARTTLEDIKRFLDMADKGVPPSTSPSQERVRKWIAHALRLAKLAGLTDVYDAISDGLARLERQWSNAEDSIENADDVLTDIRTTVDRLAPTMASSMDRDFVARELVMAAREITGRVKSLRLKDAVTNGTIRVEVMDEGPDYPVEVSLSVSPANVGATLYLDHNDVAKLSGLFR